MLLDAFQALTHVGFPLRSYQYTGFGSVSFVDFILLHKYLGITQMLSVEHSLDIKKRILFNRPFERILEMEFGPVSGVIPKLSADRRHLLWLDYDDVINKGIIEDVQGAASRLSLSSILLVTVDIEAPGKLLSSTECLAYYEEEAGDFLGKVKRQPSSFVPDKLARVNIEILKNAITNGLSGRQDVDMLPLFNFVYADGHRMLTIGGMLGAERERRLIGACDFGENSYVRLNWSETPFSIRVPVLTRKERLYLDANMPCRKNWRPAAFELDIDDVDAYRDTYRYFPSYFESLL